MEVLDNKPKANKLVTCNHCGWVHFTYSRQRAEKEVQHFNEYFDELSSQKQKDYYGGKHASILLYEQCSRCGNSYKNFRVYKNNDCPEVCTLSPIIDFTSNIFTIDDSE